MKQPKDEQVEPELCPTCGTVMVTTDGESYCPKCASEIDWGIEDEDEAK